MAKSGGKKARSLTQLAASLDTRKRPLPPELQASAAEARALLKQGKAPVETDAVPRSAALVALVAMPPSKSKVRGKPARKDARPVSLRLAVERQDKPVEASVSPRQISLGGLFVRTKAPLKLGAKATATLVLPPKREIRVKGEIVRVERVASGEPGVALRFTEYLDGAEAALMAEVVAPALREFVASHAEAHGYEASAEYVAHTVDVLAAWELRKAERGGDVWELADE